MKNVHLLIGILGLALAVPVSAQPAGWEIEARGLCLQAVEMEKQRRVTLDPRFQLSDLENYCNRLSKKQVEHIDWRCIIRRMDSDKSLKAARKICAKTPAR